MTDRTSIAPAADAAGQDRPARKPFVRTVALALVLGLALSGGLAACGKKGSPKPPPGEESDYPRTYPDPSTY